MEKDKLVEAALQLITEYQRFANEILPQAGGLVLDINKINDGLIFASKIEKELKCKTGKTS